MCWQEIPNAPNPWKICSLTFNFKSSYACFCSLDMNQIKPQKPKLIRNNEFKSFNRYTKSLVAQLTRLSVSNWNAQVQIHIPQLSNYQKNSFNPYANTSRHESKYIYIYIYIYIKFEYINCKVIKLGIITDGRDGSNDFTELELV